MPSEQYPRFPRFERFGSPISQLWDKDVPGFFTGGVRTNFAGEDFQIAATITGSVHSAAVSLMTSRYFVRLGNNGGGTRLLFDLSLRVERLSADEKLK